MALSKSVISQDGYLNRQLSAQVKVPVELQYRDLGRLLSQQIGFEKIKCFQPVRPGHFQLTFTSMANLLIGAEKGIKYRGDHFEITPMYSPEKKVLIRNAPFEMPSALIQAALQCYGKTSEIEREKDPEFGVYNGNRRCKIMASKEIPNFIRIGRYNIMLTYTGVKPLCRKCHRDSHLAIDCDTPFCKTCFEYGHAISECRNKKTDPKKQTDTSTELQHEQQTEPLVEQAQQNSQRDVGQSQQPPTDPNNVQTTSNAEDTEKLLRELFEGESSAQEEHNGGKLLFSQVAARPASPVKTTPQKRNNTKETETRLSPIIVTSTTIKKRKHTPMNVQRQPDYKARLVNLNPIDTSPAETRSGRSKKDKPQISEPCLSEDSGSELK